MGYSQVLPAEARGLLASLATMMLELKRRKILAPIPRNAAIEPYKIVVSRTVLHLPLNGQRFVACPVFSCRLSSIFVPPATPHLLCRRHPGAGVRINQFTTIRGLDRDFRTTWRCWLGVP